MYCLVVMYISCCRCVDRPRVYVGVDYEVVDVDCTIEAIADRMNEKGDIDYSLAVPGAREEELTG